MGIFRSPIGRCIAVAVGALAAYAVLPLQGDHLVLAVTSIVVLFALAVPVLWRLVGRVNQPDAPAGEPLAFLAAIGTLAITLPATCYVVASEITPGSFTGLETKIDALYFTVTIASTTGFGDIHAVSQGARLLTTLHIIASIVVLGSLLKMVARVIGVRVTEHHRRDGPR